MDDLNDMSAQEIGRRLRLARENKGIRQDEAAQLIGMSRPTLVSIEKGARRVRISELQVLAHRYGVSANSLLRREAVHTDLVPRFRSLPETGNEHKKEAIQVFSDLIKADVELENVLGIERRRNYPPYRGIYAGDVLMLAEKHAQEFRDRLGLGAGPIGDIFSVIELNLGIRLYQRRLSSNSKVAGLFTCDDNVGACIFLNANHPLPRRIQSAAHELGHFYGARDVPDVHEANERSSSREERYASAFGRALLTPAESFKESFRQLKNITGKITRRLIILLSHEYNISRQACTLRLEELGLAKKGTWDWFENNGRITKDHVREVLGEMATRPDVAKADSNRPISYRISLMIHATWERALMSEGQLTELLKVSRVELRKIIDQIELEESENDDILKLPH